MLKRTPLYDAHLRHGARMIDFAGWEMPLLYTGIASEHLAVRRAAGLFDISHMGEIHVRGPSALGFLNRLLTNDLNNLSPHQGQYTLMCLPKGGVVDDLYVYRLEEELFLLVVNASRFDEDMAWLTKQEETLGFSNGLEFNHSAQETVAVAVQGPKAVAILPNSGRLMKNEIGPFDFRGAHGWISRTGYTGEDGFEINLPAEKADDLWDSLIERGGPHGLIPTGLGARDTLRIEAGFPLYGSELTEGITPIEAGLGWVVSLDKGDFIGREALEKQKSEGTERKCIGFRMTAKSPPPRGGYAILSTGKDARNIGEVTSGTQSPLLGIGLGLGYAEAEFVKPGIAIQIEIRDRRFPAEVVRKPLYKKPV